MHNSFLEAAVSGLFGRSRGGNTVPAVTGAVKVGLNKAI